MAPTPELFFSRIPSDECESDTPEKCRTRRRRRIEKRRMRISSGRLSSRHQFLLPRHREIQETLPNPQPHSVASIVVVNPMPDFGCLSIQGLSRSMGDAVFVKEEFCRPGIVGGRPLHFFAVYDGHEGSHVSKLYKEMMHKIMAEELKRLHISKANAGDNGCSCTLALAAPGWYQYQIKQAQKEEEEEEEWEELLRVGIEKSFDRMDEVALSTCGCGCQLMELAFAGSSAVVALLSRHHIMVANCGDSRAVLCRDGRAIPLSLDHKSERPNEPERIRAAEGKLIYQNGVGVYGVLNMSLSLGAVDNFLKRVIKSQPEISITKRDHEEDECLILASDGLWDVLSDDLACRVATACLRDASAATAPPPCSSRYLGRRLVKDGGGQVLSATKTKSEFAAAILLRLALARGSRDNISVIVVDLIRSNPNK